MTNWRLTKILLELEKAGLPEPTFIEYTNADDFEVEFQKKCCIGKDSRNLVYVNKRGEIESFLTTNSVVAAISKLKSLLGGDDE